MSRGLSAHTNQLQRGGKLGQGLVKWGNKPKPHRQVALGRQEGQHIEAAMTDKPETCLGAVTLVDTRTGLAQAHKA